MYPTHRQRARSLDGYRPLPPSVNGPAGFEYSSIPHYSSRRNSMSYAPAGLPPQNGLPIVNDGRHDVFDPRYGAGPAVLTRYPSGRGRQSGGANHNLVAALRQAAHPVPAAPSMQMPPQASIQGADVDQLMMAGMQAKMVQMQMVGGGVAPGMFRPAQERRAGKALEIMRGGHGKNNKKDVRFNAFANLFGGRDRHQRADEVADIPVCGYSLVKRLNPGGMSEAVNLVKKSGKLYIEKRVKFTGPANPTRKKRAKAELAALRRIAKVRPGHLNVMVEYLWEERRGFVSFILEYCDRGSLEGMLKAQRAAQQYFGKDFVWHVLVGVGKGLAFLHHGIRDVAKDKKDQRWNSICHLDLKPCNIFLSSSHRHSQLPIVTIGDFGCAITRRDVEDGMEHPRLQLCGTPEWYPPEGRPEMVGSNTRYGPETDIWQMGATASLVRMWLSIWKPVERCGDVGLLARLERETVGAENGQGGDKTSETMKGNLARGTCNIWFPVQ